MKKKRLKKRDRLISAVTKVRRKKQSLQSQLTEARQALKNIAVASAPYMGSCDAGCTLHEVNEMALAALGVDLSKIANHEEAAAAVVV